MFSGNRGKFSVGQRPYSGARYDISNDNGFPIPWSAKVIGETVGTGESTKVRPTHSAVVHRFHVAGDQEGFRGRLVDRKHILRSHYDAPSIPTTIA